jgi:hypothetical protein
MASQVIKVREWTCDHCGKKKQVPLHGYDSSVPYDWSDILTIRISRRGYKPLHLCCECSDQDPYTIIGTCQKRYDEQHQPLLTRLLASVTAADEG